MTPEEQRIAIAEACGWKHHPGEEPLYGGSSKATGWMSPNKKFHRAGHWKKKTSDGTPDYLNDLNAMHEAEKEVRKEPILWGIYCNTLAMLCGGTREDDGGMFVSHKEAIDATAPQRAEAFLKTINKWTTD